MATSRKGLDINTASADELQTLSGIGRTRAEAIVKARTVNISNFTIVCNVFFSLTSSRFTVTPVLIFLDGV